MRRAAAALGVLLLALLAYLTLWPTPLEPVAWVAPPDPGYVGPHAPNDRLAGLEMIDLGGEEGPEHVALGPDGKIYVSAVSGAVVRMDPDGGGREVFARTGGRVLGFDFDAKGRMIAADAVRGLLAIAPDGAVSVLVDAVRTPEGDEAIWFADAVVVARNGLVYFSDASTRFPPTEWGGTFEAAVLDILESSCTGRILVYDPKSRQTRLVARGLSFANGVALSEDEKTLFVAETGKYRIWTIPAAARDLDLAGGPAGGAKVLFDNLPGYPDNLMRGLGGRIWVGFTKPRNPTADWLADKAFLRKVTVRLPKALWPIPKTFGHVFAFTEDGRVALDLQDPSGAYPEATGVTETEDRLYIHSLHAKGLGWKPKNGLGLD